MNSVKFIGMDVHKNSITIAIAEEGSRDSARIYGTLKRHCRLLPLICSWS